MKILITGGAGFIGSHSTAAALAAGHSVRVLDNLSTGAAANLPGAAELIVGDVTDPVAVAGAVAGCEAILHLAALVSVPQSMAEPLQTLAVNTTATALLLAAARDQGVHRFVLASTCAVYGDLPGRKDELAPVAPLSPYAAAKRMAELWTQLYAQAFALETVILRYFNVYGPRQRADSPYSGVIARWRQAAVTGAPCIIFGDGSQTRDFVSVHDVAAANLLALTASGAPPQPAPTAYSAPAALQWGGIYNVATGHATSLGELLASLEAAVQTPIQRQSLPARPGDILHSAGSSAALQALGWRPRVLLKTGLAELVQ